MQKVIKRGDYQKYYEKMLKQYICLFLKCLYNREVHIYCEE